MQSVAIKALTTTTGESQPAASRYDFFKVKIWVEPRYQHYFVLSRFLVSRMLTVVRIDSEKAVRIALKVKQFLVDRNVTHIRQCDFQRILFFHLAATGFGAALLKEYMRVSRFFADRTPLITIIGGPPCALKTTLAQALAAEMNMPNVQHADVLYELLCGFGAAAPRLWERGGICGDDGALPPGEDAAEVLDAFRQEAVLLRQAVAADMSNALNSGKSVIMEGMHADPGLYLAEFGVLGALQTADARHMPGHRPVPLHPPASQDFGASAHGECSAERGASAGPARKDAHLLGQRSTPPANRSVSLPTVRRLGPLLSAQCSSSTSGDKVSIMLCADVTLPQREPAALASTIGSPEDAGGSIPSSALAEHCHWYLSPHLDVDFASMRAYTPHLKSVVAGTVHEMTARERVHSWMLRDVGTLPVGAAANCCVTAEGTHSSVPPSTIADLDSACAREALVSPGSSLPAAFAQAASDVSGAVASASASVRVGANDEPSAVAADGQPPALSGDLPLLHSLGSPLATSPDHRGRPDEHGPVVLDAPRQAQVGSHGPSGDSWSVAAARPAPHPPGSNLAQGTSAANADSARRLPTHDEFGWALECVEELEATDPNAAQMTRSVLSTAWTLTDTEAAAMPAMPLMVPMVVVPDECDRDTLRQMPPHLKALSNNSNSSYGLHAAHAQDEHQAPEKFARVCDVLCSLYASYAEYGVPVFRVHLGNIDNVVAQMHAHILSCIQHAQHGE